MAMPEVVPDSRRHIHAHAALLVTHSTMEQRSLQLSRRALYQWQEEGTAAAGKLIGLDSPGAWRASFLIGRNLASTTQAGYQRNWERFTKFCKIDGSYALPSSARTVARYLGHLYDQNKVRGTSLRPYIAAIGTQHRRCGMVDPTKDPMVFETRQGYLDNDAKRGSGPPMRSAPLPAEKAEIALYGALHSTSHASLIRWGIVALGFLICSRPTRLRFLRRCDFHMQGTGVTVQVTYLKYGERGTSPRIAICIPCSDQPSDPWIRLIRRLCATTPSDLAYVFAESSGVPVSDASLRSGGISAAHATGMPLSAIMRLSNLTSADVVHRDHLRCDAPARSG